MFALIESVPQPRRSLGWVGKSVSFVMHAVRIGAAVAASNHAGRVPQDPGLAELPMVWNSPPSVSHAAVPPGSIAAPPTVAFNPALPDPIVPVVDVPPSIPGTVTDPGPIDPGPAINPGGSPGPGTITTETVLDFRVVEEPPALLTHPAIRYPEALRLAGVQGRVVVETVLDTLGRAESGSTRVTAGVHELLDRE